MYHLVHLFLIFKSYKASSCLPKFKFFPNDVIFAVNCLETELLEEPFVLSALVSVLELQSDGVTCLFALNWIFQIFWGVFCIQSYVWYAVTCWHHMVVVDHLSDQKRGLFTRKFHTCNDLFIYLDERLNLGFLVDLGLVHSARHTFWITIDASN